jgi:hypothetical protein
MTLRWDKEIVQTPGAMDQECAAICEAMNSLLGIQTHMARVSDGECPIWIWFIADELEDLEPILQVIDPPSPWQIQAQVDWLTGQISFRLEGPAGAYDELNEIARLIKGLARRIEQELVREREERLRSLEDPANDVDNAHILIREPTVANLCKRFRESDCDEVTCNITARVSRDLEGRYPIIEFSPDVQSESIAKG